MATQQETIDRLTEKNKVLERFSDDLAIERDAALIAIKELQSGNDILEETLRKIGETHTQLSESYQEIELQLKEALERNTYRDKLFDGLLGLIVEVKEKINE